MKNTMEMLTDCYWLRNVSEYIAHRVYALCVFRVSAVHGLYAALMADQAIG